MHQDGGKHFHMALKLDKKTKWLAVRNFLDMCHGIKVNFSDYDADYVLSDNHPDLTNATAPQTTNASQKRKGTAKKAGAATKKKRNAWQFTTSSG